MALTFKLYSLHVAYRLLSFDYESKQVNMFLGLSFYNFTTDLIYLRDSALTFKLYVLEMKKKERNK